MVADDKEGGDSLTRVSQRKTSGEGPLDPNTSSQRGGNYLACLGTTPTRPGPRIGGRGVDSGRGV